MLAVPPNSKIVGQLTEIASTSCWKKVINSDVVVYDVSVRKTCATLALLFFGSAAGLPDTAEQVLGFVSMVIFFSGFSREIKPNPDYNSQRAHIKVLFDGVGGNLHIAFEHASSQIIEVFKQSPLPEDVHAAAALVNKLKANYFRSPFCKENSDHFAKLSHFENSWRQFCIDLYQPACTISYNNWSTLASATAHDPDLQERLKQVYHACTLLIFGNLNDDTRYLEPYLQDKTICVRRWKADILT